MTDVKDLHIEKEILPLFDFTQNDFSKKVLFTILNTPLNSINDIHVIQDILKGFIENNEILKEFSYSRGDLMDVHEFLERLIGSITTKKELRLQLLFSEK